MVGVGEYGRKRKLPVQDTQPKKRSKKNKRKLKIDGQQEINESLQQEFSSKEESFKVVSEFHTLNKQLSQVKEDKFLSTEQKDEKIKEIEQKISELGGIEKYQRASIFASQTKENATFSCSKWVLQELKFRGFGKKTNSENKKKLLDVGAINNQYLNCSTWLEITPIDLNPQHPSVIKADFFDFAKNKISEEKKEPFDGIILSLVVNFVGDIKKRGEMLALCSHGDLLKKEGLLFIVLPLACVQNSRYMKYSRFVKIVTSLGFQLVSYKNSAKLAFWIFQLDTPSSVYDPATSNFTYPIEFPRKLTRGGKDCNNFTIILKNPNEEGQDEGIVPATSDKPKVVTLSEDTSPPVRDTKKKKKSSKKKANKPE